MKYEFIILGGSGHVGSALATELLKQWASVLVIGHDVHSKSDWEQKGAAYETVDILDSDALNRLFTLGERLFILNPPAPSSTDTVAVERKQVMSIIKALENLPLRKIVMASTYGAQPGDRIGDLGVLYQLEQALATQSMPVAIIRSAYYMSNWAMSLKSVQQSGLLPSLYPADFELPMVAPQDIGIFAATLMTGDTIGLNFIEGPQRYTPNDVAAAFSKALHKPVKLVATPQNQWMESLLQAGFSDPAAEYMVNMTRLVLDDKMEAPNPHRGSTSLDEYITQLFK